MSCSFNWTDEWSSLSWKKRQLVSILNKNLGTKHNNQVRHTCINSHYNAVNRIARDVCTNPDHMRFVGLDIKQKPKKKRVSRYVKLKDRPGYVPKVKKPHYTYKKKEPTKEYTFEMEDGRTIIETSLSVACRIALHLEKKETTDEFIKMGRLIRSSLKKGSTSSKKYGIKHMKVTKLKGKENV